MLCKIPISNTMPLSKIHIYRLMHQQYAFLFILTFMRVDFYSWSHLSMKWSPLQSISRAPTTRPMNHARLNTWSKNNVVITSKGRHLWRVDVITTSLFHNVSVGMCKACALVCEIHVHWLVGWYSIPSKHNVIHIQSNATAINIHMRACWRPPVK